MDDDFLHRLRKAPPPAFLDGLKARIERQFPLARTGGRRLPFARGLIVGLLVGGAAFAVTSLSVNRAPASFADFLEAPVQLITALGNRSSQGENGQQRRVIPWGPVWGPKHPVPPEEIPRDTDSAAFVGTAATSTASAAATGQLPEAERAPAQTPLPATQSAGSASRYVGLTVVAPPSTYPHAQAVAERLGNGFVGMRVSLETGGAPVSRLCSTDDKGGGADLIEMPGRVTPAEFRSCVSNITESKVGHQAIVIARSKLYGSMTLSDRDLFLALARQIPVNSDPSLLLMDNPYTTWNQVDATLPDDRIHVLGPGLGWVQGRLAAVLLLEAGCNTFPGIAELRVTNPARYDEICTSIRDDGAYEESAEGVETYTDRLTSNPTLLGIFAFSDFDRSKDRLAASVIDAVEPSPETIAAHTYPASRALYLYRKQTYYTTTSLLGMLMRAYLAPLTQYDHAPGDWGFVPLNAAERADSEAILPAPHGPSRF